MAFDLGLSTSHATDRGDLLGQGWLARLQAHDQKISALASYRQQNELKVRCERYVTPLRGFVRAEIGRILNRLVRTHAPAGIIVKRLDFRNPNLSRRLNRILSKFGKAEVAESSRMPKNIFGSPPPRAIQSIPRAKMWPVITPALRMLVMCTNFLPNGSF